MLQRSEFEQWVPFPLVQVFRFFANPENLPRIMPPKSDTRIDQLKFVPPAPELLAGESAHKLAGVGSEIITSFRILPPLPLRAQWVARITEFEWNRFFADIQAHGPFKSWHHRHEFESVTRNGVNGTVARDRIEYEIGFGVFGAVAQKIFVARELARTFHHRQQILETLLRDSSLQ
jgi:ligand-binding SRPBCC domain-containing protein